MEAQNSEADVVTRTEAQSESPSIAALAAALAKAQGAMRSASKDSDNPFFRSKYADLDACWDAAREPLSSNNLAVAQRVRISPGWVHLDTMLMHSSGEWMRDVSDWPVTKPPKKGMDGKEYQEPQADPSKPYVPTPQVLGSVISYARRYTLCALVSITAGEDDDGNAASAPPQERQQRQVQRERPQKEIQVPVPETKSARAPVDPVAQKLRARAAALWTSAQKRGLDKDAFQVWAAGVLGKNVPSSQWAQEDLDHLEVASQEPPPSSGPPPDDVPC